TFSVLGMVGGQLVYLKAAVRAPAPSIEGQKEHAVRDELEKPDISTLEGADNCVGSPFSYRDSDLRGELAQPLGGGSGVLHHHVRAPPCANLLAVVPDRFFMSGQSRTRAKCYVRTSFEPEHGAVLPGLPSTVETGIGSASVQESAFFGKEGLGVAGGL